MSSPRQAFWSSPRHRPPGLLLKPLSLQSPQTPKALAPTFLHGPGPGQVFWAVTCKAAGRAHSLGGRGAGTDEWTQAPRPLSLPGSESVPPSIPSALLAALPASAERLGVGQSSWHSLAGAQDFDKGRPGLSWAEGTARSGPPGGDWKCDFPAVSVASWRPPAASWQGRVDGRQEVVWPGTCPAPM